MAKQATSGQPRITKSIKGSYDIGPNENYIAIAAGWVAGTVTLPGPDTDNDPPNDGDQYTIVDVTAAVTSGETLTINGGGYKFLSAGSLVASATFDGLNSAAGETLPTAYGITFTFIADQQLWAVTWGG